MPKVPPRVCARCRQAVPPGPCPTCDQPWARKPSSWPIGAGHRRWRKLRAAILRGEPFCRRCGHLAQVVDHITPLSQGGARYDPANCQPLCDDCHNAKTEHESRASRRIE